MLKVSLFLIPLFAGCAAGEYSACDDMCTELIRSCGYDAFPSTDSCMTGCAFEAERGADVDGQADCILEAECDTIAIIECQNTYGSTP